MVRYSVMWKFKPSDGRTPKETAMEPSAAVNDMPVHAWLSFRHNKEAATDNMPVTAILKKFFRIMAQWIWLYRIAAKSVPDNIGSPV